MLQLTTRTYTQLLSSQEVSSVQQATLAPPGGRAAKSIRIYIRIYIYIRVGCRQVDDTYFDKSLAKIKSRQVVVILK